MNIDQLKEALQAYYDDQANLGVCVYALTKNTVNSGLFKLDIESDAEIRLKELFMKSLRDEISIKEGLTLLPLSTTDERTDAIYEYDLEIPEELKTLEDVISRQDLQIMNLNEESLSTIRALLILIGNDARQLVLYKIIAPINIFGRTSFFLLKHESRLVQLRDEFLRVGAGFQMMRIDGNLLVINLESLEKNFGFHDVIKREAALGVDKIISADLLTNPDILKELVEDIKYARRFTKIAKSSPVLKLQISGEKIFEFCKMFPGLLDRIKFNDENNKITLDTKVSKDLFIKILQDDFLTSELTKFHYASVSKDPV